LDAEIKAKKLALQTTEQKLSQLNGELAQKTAQLKEAAGVPNRFFVGELFQDEADRDFLIQTILEQYPKQRIVRTKHLYLFPLMHVLHPHRTIDGNDNFVVIVTFQSCNAEGKNYMMAMYSERPLVKGTSEFNVGRGFVASLTNRRVFKLVKNNKDAALTEYSDYFIIFGKGEIQFKINSDVMEFNIGHNQRSLDTQKEKDPTVFTGSAEEKMKMIKYEVYQVIFGEGPTL
jgi:hypothetical protein